MRGKAPLLVRVGGRGGESGFLMRAGIKVGERRRVLWGFPVGGEWEAVWHLGQSHRLKGQGRLLQVLSTFCVPRTGNLNIGKIIRLKSSTSQY